MEIAPCRSFFIMLDESKAFAKFSNKITPNYPMK